MTRDIENRKAQLVDAAAKALADRLKGKEAERAERFLRLLYAHVPPDDLLGDTAENVAGAALALWSFAQKRDPEKAKIRVYTPSREEHGWDCGHSVAEIVNDDMPFLVDSVSQELNRLQAEVFLVIHPILAVERDDKGRLLDIGLPGDEAAEGRPESLMLVHFGEQPATRHAEIEAALAGVLADVRASVEDWRAMRTRCRDLVRDLEKNPPKLPREEIAEAVAFLDWLDDDNFTYLGYREYSFEEEEGEKVARIDGDSGLGLLRDPGFSVFDGLRNLGQLPPDVQEWVTTPMLLRVNKANRRSTVHRSTHLDTIAIKTFGRKGEVTGERLFVGLFTSTAYNSSPRAIPLLRRKVESTVERAGLMPGSHDGKALMHILETYPRDELFQIDEADLAEIALGILHLQERQRTALFIRQDPFERFVSCMIFVPRERFDTSLRLKIQARLEQAFAGTMTAFHTEIGESPLARLHLIVRTTQGALPAVDRAALEAELAELARAWDDRLQEALVAAYGEERGLRSHRRYRNAFPSNYREIFGARDAVADIRNLESTARDGELALDLYRPPRAVPGRLHFKVYHGRDPLPLSDVLPLLEHMGLRVIGEVPYEVQPAGAQDPIWIHDFDMRLQAEDEIDIAAVRDAFHEVFGLTWRGEMENDGFNALVLAAGLDAAAIRILRAYAKYLRQAAIPFSQEMIEATLVGHPKIAQALTELFRQRFDPARVGRKSPAKALEACQPIVEAIDGLLEKVTSLDEDRILRRYLNLIVVTERTNYYQLDESGRRKPYVSFKFDADKIEELPQPRPYREIFVYSPQVEGVHIRFGPVARGGLRWSDRREDFRTEVLGLVKAQRVKNAVIVPVGSKGGFFPKRLPADRDGRIAEGVAAYKTFLRGLLDITDNLKGDKVVPPRQVVRYDADDPYLVVAADKGTATFSDYANGVSADYGFWLDDAFASGGSAGYDHKAMGITARGAWEGIKRHFRELGKDIQSEDFTVIGVGDMGGDVFGNGMLLSRHIRLLGAFNHLHIFIDPDPDPAKSWKERKRLFDAAKGWDQYDVKLISKGGGVFDRKAKSIKLSAEMKAAFGLAQDVVTPNELIRGLLRCPVELLWFGGIGTYVKASEESHLDVGDRANDGLRVNGEELGAKVVGEGANLGMTQKGRIEFALAGGRLNTDAIDNSAGVDCSDHEVNIKILLGKAEHDGKLARAKRDKLLAAMTDEVGQLVLRDNYLQTQCISVTERLGAHLLDRLGRYTRVLERAGKLDRALEFLPDDEELGDRFNAGRGLTRPEIAVLLSYAKIDLFERLMSSSLPDDPYLDLELRRYFPQPLQERYGDDIEGHRLRREIVATQVTNTVVNRMGIAFVHEVGEKTGMPADEICRAYVVAREAYGLRTLWSEIEALDVKADAAAQYLMLVECGRLAERFVVWLLRNEAAGFAIAELVETYGPGIAQLTPVVGELLHEDDRRVLDVEVARLAEARVPDALARRVAALRFLGSAGDIVRIAREAGLPVVEAGRLYFRIGSRFGFDWLRRIAGRLPSDSAWDKLAVTAIVDDLYSYQFQVAHSVVANGAAEPAPTGRRGDGGDSADSSLERWAADRTVQVTRTDQLLAELRAMASPDLAMLAVANRQLKSLVGG
ncbi:glutamate dehydrogenase (NAD) [Tistlia consotensis]|uniref:Glutamate dehydrogenase (NAD) n=1 Tax=Tistlia consotensis USBA 355 TaxID=560819 RepID=A0A1Y6BM45_9PROT|nr:NAD-glutamate dehydrogenase [Tistlia consotensis]SMF09719.1 glutamate dehydrogenase (NAD) [Tistlia consotensis USBA 355]SNR34292.1 glutamate dehydrogenase (NAD) [Tistlia consotensis]